MHASPQELEKCDCLFCGRARPPQSRYSHGPFAVVRCPGCQLWYLSPRLTEDAIRDYYQASGYYEGSEAGYSSYEDQERSLRMTFRALLGQMALRGITGGRLLEIGCGYGYLLDEARDFFDERIGTEMSPEACERSQHHADSVYVGGIGDIPPGERFDCIVSLQVIEHIYDPVAFMQKAAGHLSEHGALVVSTPNMGSFWRLLMGNRWASFKYPEHVAFYDAQTLKALMQKAGLVDLERIPHPHAFPAGEVLAKLGMPGAREWLPGSLWVPATTIAFAGRLTAARKER